MLELVGMTAGIALDFLETGHAMLPFCRITTPDGKTVAIMTGDGDIGREEDGYLDRCANSVWTELKQRIAAGEVAEFAFCSDNIVKLQGEATEQRMLRIEFQNGTKETGVYYFPLSVENGKASVGKYKVADVREQLI